MDNIDLRLTNSNIVYFTANSALPSNTSAGQIYKSIAFSLLIDVNTAEIIDADVNLLNSLAIRFIRSQLVGRNLKRDWDRILNDLTRFQAPAQKAVIVALKSVLDRYNNYVLEKKHHHEKQI